MTELGKEYASALFELARENSCEKEFSDALGLIERQFEAQPQYAELLSSPDISIGERRKLLEAAFCGKVPEYVMSFTELLCENGRIKLFGECVSEYEKMYRAVRLVSTAKVTSAVELTAEEKQKLTEKLEKLCGHGVVAEYETDKNVIGGLVVRMDDILIDGSVETKLKQIKEVIEK